MGCGYYSTKETSSDRRPFFLMILYGTLEYDGRAQRLLSILKTLGNVFVVDVAPQVETESICAVPRRSVQMPFKAGVVQRHLRFWRTVLAEVLHYRPQVIVGANFFTTFPACISAMLVGVQFIYDAHELIIPEPGISMSWRDRFWYRMEQFTIRRADLIISANEDRARLMQTHYNLVNMPIVMRNIPYKTKVENSVTVEKTILARYPKLARRYPEECLVLYQGDVSIERGIDRFVRALAYLPSEFRMIVVGGGSDLEHLRVIGQLFEFEGRFATLGRIENHMLPIITAMADIGIVTYPFQGLNNIYCAPNKVFEYAQAGLPVITTNQPPLRRMIEHYKIGELVDEHDEPEHIAAVIQKIRGNRGKYVKALVPFLEGHRWEDEEKRVREAIESFLNRSINGRGLNNV